MPILENDSSVSSRGKKKKFRVDIDNGDPINELPTASDKRAAKRRADESPLQLEQPRKKRKRDRLGVEDATLNGGEGNGQQFESRNESSDSTRRKKKKSRPRNSEGEVETARYENDMTPNGTAKEKKPKNKKSKEGKKNSGETNVEVTREVPMNSTNLDSSVLPFGQQGGSSSALGIGTGSTSDDIMRAIDSMDISSLSLAAGQQFSVSSDPPSGRKAPPRKDHRASVGLQSKSMDLSDPSRLLSTRWLKAKEIQNLVEEHGFEIKRGAFTNSEKAALQAALDTFANQYGLSDAEVVELLYTKKGDIKHELRSFWSDIGVALPMRPLTSIYNYARRAYHPLQKQGKWSQEEHDTLVAAVAEFGQIWTKVSERVGRSPDDCKDRFKNHVKDISSRKHGPWTPEEEAELFAIMAEFDYQTPKNEEADGFWLKISQRLGHRRGPAQVRSKWQDHLSRTLKAEGSRRWMPIDSYILVHKLATMSIEDDSEIDWHLLGDDGWNLWSAHNLQRHWQTMKKSVENSTSMPFYEILDILLAKKGSLTQDEIDAEILRTQEVRTPKPRKIKEHVSKELIEDSEEDVV